MKSLHAVLNALIGRTQINIEARDEQMKIRICNENGFANAGEDKRPCPKVCFMVKKLHPYKKTMLCKGEPCVHPATHAVRSPNPLNLLARVSAIFLLSSFGFAQTATGVTPVNVASRSDLALPLVSIGSSVGWKIGAEDYRLNVAQSLNNASLEVYSPEINLNDYANKTDRKNYYGDELYAKNAKLETTFKLSNSANLQLVNKKFGASLKHSFVQLFAGSLNAGFYPMSVQSLGNGKNSYQIRASQGVRVEASQFTVNVRGQFGQDQLVAFLDIGKDAIGQKVTLENYDADGKNEMSLSLVEPTNSVPLAISENLAWKGNTILVTPDLVGTWKILTRVLPTTKQFSNSVAFRFKIGGKPLFARIPGFPTPKTAFEPAKPAPTGVLQVSARANICGTVLQIKAGFKIKGIQYQAPTSLRLAPGNYTLLPDQLAGAKIQAVSVNIKANEVSSVNLNYVVALALSAQPQVLELKPGQSANLDVQVTTAFALVVPINLKLTPSAGIKVGTVSAGQALNSKAFKTSVVVSASSSGTINISLGAGCPTLEIPVKVTAPEPSAPAKLTLEKTVDRIEVTAGETVNYTITARNIGGSSANEIKLVDVLPQGLNGKNLQETFELKAGETRVFKLSAQVASDAKGSILNTATLDGNQQKLIATANVRVKVMPAPIPEPRALPAKLKFAKTVDRFEVNRGDTVQFTITVSNTAQLPQQFNSKTPCQQVWSLPTSRPFLI
jgi:uncharacterized repeat protein (TIGR01451 family)